VRKAFTPRVNRYSHLEAHGDQTLDERGFRRMVLNSIRAGLSPLRDFARWRPFGVVHFSQEGEDIILERLFSAQRSGFYVDIGSHHPRRFSNSYWAYLRGWIGINVDAAPGSSAVFDRVRPRDTNLETCIAESPGEVEFFVFPEPALNTAGRDRKDAMEAVTSSRGERVVVPAERLETLLDKYLPDGDPAIDFMSIDVEGSEMAVLRSNDWERYRPRVIVIEVLGKVLQNMGESEEIRFLTELDYVPVSMLYHSVVLIGDDALLSAHWQRASD
jgi:FkbM family methyltransferase